MQQQHSGRPLQVDSVNMRQVHAMLLLAAERTPGFRKEPPPFVIKVGLSDFYVEYELKINEIASLMYLGILN